jgi:hypothetical protein
MDPHGLWTEIERKPVNVWAATCAQEGDTWASLAVQVNLNASEYRRWLKEGPTAPAAPTVGEVYHVPNVFVVVTGEVPGKWYWGTWGTGAVIARGHLARMATEATDTLNSAGYHVRRLDANRLTGVVQQAERLINSGYVTGFVYFGHGGGPGTGVDGWAAVYVTPKGLVWYKPWGKRYAAKQVIGPNQVHGTSAERAFGKSYVMVFACFASLADWRSAVSTTGTLFTVNGVDWSILGWSNIGIGVDRFEDTLPRSFLTPAVTAPAGDQPSIAEQEYQNFPWKGPHLPPGH